MSLWRLPKSDLIMRSPQRRARTIPNQRASFCICQKASYTLEVAVVIPLLAGYLVMLLFFFYILQIQCQVEEALIYAGRKTAVEASIVDSEELLLVSAEAYLLQAIKDYPLVEKYVEQDRWGIQIWESEFYGEYLVLKARYVVELPISFFGIGEMELSSQNRFRKWTGEHSINIDVDSNENGYFVYVTSNGNVYHASLSCRVLDLSVKDINVEGIPNLRGKNGQKYYECSRCSWAEWEGERVYYTDYGTKYHKDISCSSLKRTIEKIDWKNVGNRRPCSYCYEE